MLSVGQMSTVLVSNTNILSIFGNWQRFPAPHKLCTRAAQACCVITTSKGYIEDCYGLAKYGLTVQMTRLCKQILVFNSMTHCQRTAQVAL